MNAEKISEAIKLAKDLFDLLANEEHPLENDMLQILDALAEEAGEEIQN